MLNIAKITIKDQSEENITREVRSTEIKYIDLEKSQLSEGEKAISTW